MFIEVCRNESHTYTVKDAEKLHILKMIYTKRYCGSTTKSGTSRKNHLSHITDLYSTGKLLLPMKEFIADTQCGKYMP